MKSFRTLMLLTLATTLSCGANGSPTNFTTDGYPTEASPAVLKDILNSLQDIARPYFQKYGDAYPFTKEYVERLGWVRPYNYIICKVDHDYKFDGKEGEDWASTPIYKPSGSPKEPPTEFYDVVIGGSGWYERKGKGGYENWAWDGFVQKGQDVTSNRIVFVKPPTGWQTEGSGN